MSGVFEKIRAEREAKKLVSMPQIPVGTTGATIVEPKSDTEPANSAQPPKEPLDALAPAPSTQSTTTEEKSGAVAEPIPFSQPSAPVSPLQPTPAPKVICPPEVSDNFDGSPVESEEAIAIMLYGGKGDSKTTTAFSVTLLPTESHPEPTIDNPNEYKIACLSFDQASNYIKKSIYKDNPNIKVFDPTRYYSKEDDSTHLSSATRSFRYWRWLLTEGDVFKFQPDFIILDALEIFKEIVEMKMRDTNNLQPYEKFANWGYWHQRTDFMDDIDRLMKRLAKKAVIYTSYINFQEIEDKHTGKVTVVEPKWAGNTKTKTLVVIKLEAVTTDKGREFFAIVESSKIGSIRTSGRKPIGHVGNDGIHDIIGLKALGSL